MKRQDMKPKCVRKQLWMSVLPLQIQREEALKKAVAVVDRLVANMGFDLESALKTADITEEQYNKYKSGHR